MSEHDDETKRGDIEMVGKDLGVPPTPFDRIAVGGRGELLMVSLVAETQRVKQIRAILAGGARVTIQAAGVKIKRPGDEPWRASHPGRLLPTPEGYQCHTHKLGFGLAHALFLTRMPGFMKVVTPESLWQELTSTRFTTPILKDWVPYLERQLRADESLEEAHVFRCQCGVLTATTRTLSALGKSCASCHKAHK